MAGVPLHWSGKLRLHRVCRADQTCTRCSRDKIEREVMMLGEDVMAVLGEEITRCNTDPSFSHFENLLQIISAPKREED